MRLSETCGRVSTAFGLIRSTKPPLQIESSLRVRISLSVLPYTIAPRRPLPIGKAALKSTADVEYQKFVEALRAARTVCV
jgi:hypothetical protein